MKVKQKILIVVASYVAAIIVLFWGTSLYIDKKTVKLRTEATERFEICFKNQNQFVDTEYSNMRINYSQTHPPTRPSSDFLRNLAQDWDEKYSDIYRYFKINSGGWQLFVASKINYNTMYIANIYPTSVGYRRQDNSYMYSWIPSVEDCVKEAYDFWVSDPKSNYIDTYQKGNKNRINDLIRDVPNEYFDWYHFDNYGSMGNSEDAGYMYNGYYKVFSGRTNYQTYEIKQLYDVIDSDKKNKLLTGGIILTVILMCFLIPLLIQNNRNEKKKKECIEEYEKRKNESIYDKLADLCNPAKFMNPYDKEKVEKANSIYEQLMKTSSYDIKTLKKLRQQAIDELNLNFINVEYLQDLKSKCNPKRYLQPYDAEKVRVANEIYKSLIDNETNIQVLEEIETEIKEKLL